MALTRPEERMHKKAIIAWRINGIIAFIIEALFVAAYFIVNHVASLALPVFIGIILVVLLVLLGILQIVIIPIVRWYYWGYEISESEIDVQVGFLIIRRAMIPMSRIQHVDIKHGPVLRFFKLATLTVSTAGSNHDIPALPLDVAHSLHKKIVHLANVSEDDV